MGKECKRFRRFQRGHLRGFYAGTKTKRGNLRGFYAGSKMKQEKERWVAVAPTSQLHRTAVPTEEGVWAFAGILEDGFQFLLTFPKDGLRIVPPENLWVAMPKMPCFQGSFGGCGGYHRKGSSSGKSVPNGFQKLSHRKQRKALSILLPFE